ncbi:hypothetical protein QJS10_CPB15g01435 [Acorus calamus]|uniref:Uncharacterized protein n=1 Tax=Acorus calamus TaxID=4465 RepID=A0AAV9D4G0_ACOCL|nr:hypothetical protein QJS10_CPB15g01435 [Acorus calamus]
MKDKLFHVPKRWACEVCLTRVKTEPADDHSSSPLRISQEEVRGSKVRSGGQQLSRTSRSKWVQTGKVKFIPTEEWAQGDSSCTRSGQPRVTGNLNPSSRCPGRSQDAQLFVSSSKLVELPESRHEEKDSLEVDRTSGSEKDSSTMPCEKEHANGDVSNREVGMPDIQANEASPAGLDAPMFLWGVFRQMKNKRPPPPLPTTRHLSFHIDSDSQPNNTPSVGSSEAEDMEVDMIGGILIGNIGNVVKRPIVLEMGNAIDSHGSSSVERRRIVRVTSWKDSCNWRPSESRQRKLVKKVIKEEIGDYDDLFAPPGFPEPLYREPNYSSLGAAKKAEETQQAEDRVNSNLDKETRSPGPMSSRHVSKGSFVPATGEPVRHSNWSPRQVPDSQKSPLMCSTFGSPTWPEWEKKHKSSTGRSSTSSAGYRCARVSELGEIKSSANIRSRKEGARIIDMSKLQEKCHVVSDCENQILLRAHAPNSDLRPSMERDGGQKSFSRLFGPCDNDASPRCESYYRGISPADDDVRKKHKSYINVAPSSDILSTTTMRVSDQGRDLDPKKSLRTSMHPPDGASNFPSAKPLLFRSPTRPATNQFMISPRPMDYPDSKAKGPM